MSMSIGEVSDSILDDDEDVKYKRSFTNESYAWSSHNNRLYHRSGGFQGKREEASNKYAYSPILSLISDLQFHHF